MTHLSPSEFVDLAEGTLAVARAAHAETCDRCSAQASIVRDALQMTRAASAVPEPSPVFWDRLSARIREGIDQEPRRFGFRWMFDGVQPIVAALTLVVAVFSVALLTRRAPPVAAPGSAGVSAVAVADRIAREPDTTLDWNDDEAWAVLTAVAADLEFDEARDAGMAVQPAALDSAVQELSAAELTELGRLLQSELKRSGN